VIGQIQLVEPVETNEKTPSGRAETIERCLREGLKLLGDISKIGVIAHDKKQQVSDLLFVKWKSGWEPKDRKPWGWVSSQGGE
jgi:hypothetical protein